MQSITRVVRDAHRLLLAVVRNHREDRAEHFLLRDRRARLDVEEHRGLDVPATIEVRWYAASGREASALIERRTDQDERLLLRAAGDERAHGGRLVHRVAHDVTTGSRDERLDERRLQRARYDHAGERRADLATVAETEGVQAASNEIEVSIGQHDGGRLPTELELKPSEARCREGRDPRTGRRASGERDLAHVGVHDERLPDVASPADQSDHAVRYAGLATQVHEQSAGDRRLGRRLEHDAAAGQDRRHDLLELVAYGHVPGHDPGDDTDRLAHDERIAVRIAAHGLERHLPHGVDVHPDDTDGVRQRERGRVRRTHRAAAHPRELRRTFGHELTEPAYDADPVSEGRVRPLATRQCGRGSAHREIDVVDRGSAHACEHLLGRGIDDLGHRTARLTPRAVDEDAAVLLDSGHVRCPGPARWAGIPRPRPRSTGGSGARRSCADRS